MPEPRLPLPLTLDDSIAYIKNRPPLMVKFVHDFSRNEWIGELYLDWSGSRLLLTTSHGQLFTTLNKIEESAADLILAIDALVGDVVVT